MWSEVGRLHEAIGHERMQEPSSGWKGNSTGGVKDHIPRAEGRESLVESGGTGATSGRTGVDADQGAGARLQGAVCAGVLLFPLCSPVLEPNFHLGFGQT